MKYLIITLCVLLVACQQLVPDEALPSFSSNDPTAEFVACGGRHDGQAICYVEEGQNYNDIEFKIQGHHKGIINIVSSDCRINNSSFQYTKSQLYPIDIEGKVTHSCVIEFLVSPEYPKNPGIKIWNLKGYLYIKIKNKNALRHYSKVDKVKQDFTSFFHGIIDHNDTFARVVFKSKRCGIDYDENVSAHHGLISINLMDILDTTVKRTCFINGAIISESNKKYLATWIVSVYDYSYNRLAVPAVDLGGRSITITAPPETSLVSLNNNYRIERRKKFSFDKKKDNVVRILTVKGRTVFGVWNKEQGKFKWTR